MTVRVRSNSITGVVQEAPLSNAATALAMAGRMQNLATVGAGQIAALVIDPEGTDVLAGSGTEIVYVTAYTHGGGSATISRGKEGTTGRPHSAGTRIVHSPTNLDFGGSVFGFDSSGNLAVSGSVSAIGTDNYFGAYATGVGTGVSRLRLSASAGGVAMYAEGDGSDRDLSLISKGTGAFFLYNDATELATITDTGQTQWVGADHFLGEYALNTGTGVSRLHVLTDASSAILEAQGDGADRNMVLRQKGAGGFFLQKADGTTLAEIDAGGGVSAVGNAHYLGGYALGTGTGVSRLHVLTDAFSVIQSAEGDGADRNFVLQTKGAGVIALQPRRATDATLGYLAVIPGVTDSVYLLAEDAASNGVSSSNVSSLGLIAGLGGLHFISAQAGAPYGGNVMSLECDFSAMANSQSRISQLNYKDSGGSGHTGAVYVAAADAVAGLPGGAKVLYVP